MKKLYTDTRVTFALRPRCRAWEWTSALRMALESRGLTRKTV